MNRNKTLAVAALAAATLTALTGCAPRAGDKCDPSKDSSYFSSHTENGKTTTVSLECKQVGYRTYKWVKV